MLPGDPEPKLWFHYFPYLQIETSIEVGRWRVSPWREVPDPWRSSELGRRAGQLLAAYRGPDRAALVDPAVIDQSTWSAGFAPEEPALESLATAVTFGAISQNAREMAIDWEGHGQALVTRENSALWGVGIDVHSGFIATSRGSLVGLRVGGLRLDDPALSFPAPPEVIEVRTVRLDPQLLNAAYDVACRAVDRTDPVAESVAVALRWHAKAWDNSAAVDFGDRIVYLKTALESLGMSDRAPDAFRELEQTYAAISGIHGARKFLWTDDPTTYEREKPNGETVPLRAFEHWYWHFSDTRNAIIHDGRLPGNGEYTAGESAFNGNVWRVGERVVRELITIRLAQLSNPYVALSQSERQMVDYFTGLGKASALALIQPI